MACAGRPARETSHTPPLRVALLLHVARAAVLTCQIRNRQIRNRQIRHLQEAQQEAVGDAGAIPHLLDLLSSPPPPPTAIDPASGGTRARAASALLLCSVRARNAERIYKADGVQKLVAALRSGVTEAAGVLANVALACDGARDVIIEADALPTLVELLSTGAPTAQEEA